MPLPANIRCMQVSQGLLPGRGGLGCMHAGPPCPRDSVPAFCSWVNWEPIAQYSVLPTVAVKSCPDDGPAERAAKEKATLQHAADMHARKTQEFRIKWCLAPCQNDLGVRILVLNEP